MVLITCISLLWMWTDVHDSSDPSNATKHGWPTSISSSLEFKMEIGLWKFLWHTQRCPIKFQSIWVADNAITTMSPSVPWFLCGLLSSLYDLFVLLEPLTSSELGHMGNSIHGWSTYTLNATYLAGVTLSHFIKGWLLNMLYFFVAIRVWVINSWHLLGLIMKDAICASDFYDWIKFFLPQMDKEYSQRFPARIGLGAGDTPRLLFVSQRCIYSLRFHCSIKLWSNTLLPTRDI